jgi:hypothetical protein
MRAFVKEALDAMGLGIPLIYAGAVYWLFRWLDRNASAQARRAISAFLRRQPYRGIDIRTAIIAAFDRLYTSPLLRRRAVLRSAKISSIIWVIFNITVLPWKLFDVALYSGHLIGYLIGKLFEFAWLVLSDYISLFVVRRCLLKAEYHPIASLMLAGAIGILFVMSFYLSATAFFAIVMFLSNGPPLDQYSASKISILIFINVFPTAIHNFQTFY